MKFLLYSELPLFYIDQIVSSVMDHQVFHVLINVWCFGISYEFLLANSDWTLHKLQYV